MSVRYDNELVVVGESSIIDSYMPALVERGWCPTARDGLCAIFGHVGEPLGIPREIIESHRLTATLYSLETGCNTIALETSARGFHSYQHQRGLQGHLYPEFAGLEPHKVHDLTPEVAGQIAIYEGAVTLPKVTSVSPDVAGILASHRGSLGLPGLESLTPEVARELAKHRGPLELDGLLDLPVKVAREFTASSASLSFGGLTGLDPEAMQALAAGVPHPEHGAEFGRRTREFGNLKLNGIKTLTPELAAAIAKHPQNIALNGLQELSLEVARALAADRSGFIELRGVSSISDEAAEALGATSAGLILDTLRRLTPKAAAGLAQTSGGLFLNGLRFLSPEVAHALARHRGHLGLLSVTEATDEALDALSKHDGPVVLGLQGGMTLERHVHRRRRAAQPDEPTSERVLGLYSDTESRGALDASRLEKWRREFLTGRKSLASFDWLQEHLERELLGAGMPKRDAQEMAELLRRDIVGLFRARDGAQGDLSQLGHLECQDAWRKVCAERESEAAGATCAG